MYYLGTIHRPISATEFFNLEVVPSLPNVKDRQGVPRRRTHVPKLIHLKIRCWIYIFSFHYYNQLLKQNLQFAQQPKTVIVDLH
jgi:hypothetical protein